MTEVGILRMTNPFRVSSWGGGVGFRRWLEWRFCQMIDQMAGLVLIARLVVTILEVVKLGVRPFAFEQKEALLMPYPWVHG